MARLIEVAFRALLAENVKRHEVYKGNSGNGDIRWDYEVKQLDKTDNDIFYMAKAAYAAKIMQVKGSDSLKPSKLMDVLETERIKYEWFLGMFLEEDEAEDAVWQLEQSLGQIIQTSLLNNGDTGMQLYVSMAEENPKVQEGKMSLFAFYRTKFTRLRAGEQSSKPTRSAYKVNHISEGESPASEDMPEDVKAAYYSVMMQRPISKHPDGVPVREAHRQKESTSVESIWELKKNVDKVAEWEKKKEATKRKQKGSGSDSEDDKKSSSKKRSEDKSKSKKPTKEADHIKKLEQRLHKLEAKKPANQEERSRPICYDFKNKGRCLRRDCKFYHEPRGNQENRGSQRGNNNRRDSDDRRPYEDPQRKQRREGDRDRDPRKSNIEIPDNYCVNLRSGLCSTKACAANHGKFNRNSRSKCWKEERKEFCPNLFASDGCHFVHKEEYTKN